MGISSLLGLLYGYVFLIQVAIWVFLLFEVVVSFKVDVWVIPYPLMFSDGHSFSFEVVEVYLLI